MFAAMTTFFANGKSKTGGGSVGEYDVTNDDGEGILNDDGEQVTNQ